MPEIYNGEKIDAQAVLDYLKSKGHEHGKHEDSHEDMKASDTYSFGGVELKFVHYEHPAPNPEAGATIFTHTTCSVEGDESGTITQLVRKFLEPTLMEDLFMKDFRVF